MYHLDHHNSFLHDIVYFGLNQVQEGANTAFSRLLVREEGKKSNQFQHKDNSSCKISG